MIDSIMCLLQGATHTSSSRPEGCSLLGGFGMLGWLRS